MGMMTHSADREKFTESLNGALVTEASTIGLRAGLFPQTIVVDSVEYSYVMRFQDLVKYQSKDKRLLMIFNDWKRLESLPPDSYIDLEN